MKKTEALKTKKAIKKLCIKDVDKIIEAEVENIGRIWGVNVKGFLTKTTLENIIDSEGCPYFSKFGYLRWS